MTLVYLVTDARMALHAPLPPRPNSKAKSNDHSIDQNENPSRLTAIYQRLLNLENRLLVKQIYPWASSSVVPRESFLCHNSHNNRQKSGGRFITLSPCKPADRKTIELVHSPSHYDFMLSTAFLMTNEQLRDITDPNDLYFNSYTFMAATLAVGGVVESINRVTASNTPAKRAIALVRPPGHHALRDKAMGEYDVNENLYAYNNSSLALRNPSCISNTYMS